LTESTSKSVCKATLRAILLKLTIPDILANPQKQANAFIPMVILRFECTH
jgi:hypothetical protein